MIRRSLSALLVTATAAAGVLVAAPSDAATPGGTCTLNLPARISVDSLFVTRTASASGDCTKNEAEALWTTSKNFDDDEDFFDISGLGIYFRGDEFGYYGRQAITFIAGDSITWGEHAFYPAYAGRGCNDEGSCKVTYTQNTPRTDVRLASRSLLRATRHHGAVTLHGTSKLFSPTRDRFRGRDVRGVFQSRAKGGTWETLGERRTTPRGHATMKVRGAAKGTQYRYVTQSRAHWWTSISPVRTR